MSHPYSGAASYIYANELISTSGDFLNERNKGPYAHLKSLLPMHSVDSLPAPWPPRDAVDAVHLSELRLDVWGDDGDASTSHVPQTTRTAVWRQAMNVKIRKLLMRVRSSFRTIKFPSWTRARSRPNLSVVHSRFSLNF
ncbi:hypothetical protein Hypma_001900 [Hypsizygus marmoreus]|uniref:Uncharacterized protein n=1 Tax=Hypsizygus marmoreus TaxID=39966 RepID=A0A369JCF1_HYPMA|nr:hypothetical protein Hypma_001900 [Hypsizygus marmoreus]